METLPTVPSSTSNKKLILIIIACVICGLVLGASAAILISPQKKQTNTQANNDTENTKLNSENPFRIGFITPLSGDGASYGVPAKQAALIIEKELNKNGGIGGREVKMVFEDGRCSSTDSENAAKRLLNDNKIDLMYGGECSDEFLAAAPLAQQNKVFTTTASATSPKIATLGKYIYRTVPSDSLAGKAAAQYARKKMESTTAAIIAENSSYGIALKQIFNEEFTALGGKILIDNTYNTGTTRFSDFAQLVKNLKPDLVYLVPQTPTPGVLIIKALKDLQTPSKLLTAEVMLTREEVQKEGTVLDGLTGIEPSFDENKPKAKNIISLYENEYGKANSYPTDLVSMHDAFFVYKEAYQYVGNDPDKIDNYIKTKINNWEGAAGPIKFDQNGDITSLPYSIQTIKNKEIKLVEVYTVE